MKAVIAYAIAFFISTHAYALNTQFITANDTNNVGVSLSGEIREGDARSFVDSLVEYSESHPKDRITTVFLQSNGGAIAESYYIAKIIRDFNLITVVGPNGVCVSACFELFAAGTKRYIGPNAKIGVHRISIEGQETLRTQATSISYAKLLMSYGVPKAILASVMLTPAREIYYLNDQDLELMNVIRTDNDYKSSGGNTSGNQPQSSPNSGYSLSYNRQPPTVLSEFEIRAQKDKEFDAYFNEYYALSKYQNHGRAAYVKRCSGSQCENVLGYYDRQQRYVEVHQNLNNGNKAVCRRTNIDLFEDTGICINWYTERPYRVEFDDPIF